MMKLFLSIPHSRPTGVPLLNKVGTLGFDGVRVDVPDDHELATAMLGELRPLLRTYPIFLLAGGHMRRASGHPWAPDELVDHVEDTCIKLRDFGFFEREPALQPPIEIGNEPDLAADFWKKNPRLLARTFSDCFDVVRDYSPTCPVLSPSVSNLNKRGFKYLETMLDEGLPEDCAIAFHRYPHRGDMQIPHPGFDNRYQQAAKLVELAAGRDLWLTETGLAEGEHKGGRIVTEDDVARAYVYDVEFWSQFPSVKAHTLYQINDGPNRTNELHRYGIRDIDGQWKPVASRVMVARKILEGKANA